MVKSASGWQPAGELCVCIVVLLTFDLNQNCEAGGAPHEKVRLLTMSAPRGWRQSPHPMSCRPLRVARQRQCHGRYRGFRARRSRVGTGPGGVPGQFLAFSRIVSIGRAPDVHVR